MRNRKWLTVMALVVVILFTAGFDDSCGSDTSVKKVNYEEGKSMTENTRRLRAKYPIPQLTDSAELENISRRLSFLNQSGRIGYIYLLSHGNVISFYTIKGKATSLHAYMTATQSLNCESCDTLIETADVDGAYGENDDGIFFFTTEGVYVEWKGEYQYSSQPLKLSQPVQLQQEVK